jgi:hypothetical protein
MKYLLGAVILASVAACQTPSGVIDTASVVSKLTVQLNGTVADYVAANNAQRTLDEQRLVLEQQQAARQAAANADQFEILTLAGDDRARALLSALRAPIAPTPVNSQAAATQAGTSALAQQLGKNSFDTAPLTQVATTVGALAKPLDTHDQLSALVSFSQQVYGDMKTMNASTASAAAKPAAPAKAAPVPAK